MSVGGTGFPGIYFLYMGVGVSVFWLGFYVFTRASMIAEAGDLTPYLPSLFIGISCILFGLYTLGVAMESVALSPAEFLTWQRLTWWVTPFAAAFFLFAVFALDQEPRRLFASFNYRLLFFGLFIASAAIAYGMVSGFFSHPVTTRVVNNTRLFSTPPRMPQYLIYGVYVLGLLAVAAIRLIWRWISFSAKSAFQPVDLEHGAMWPLALAGGLVLIGAVIGIVAPGPISRQLGLVVIAGGVGLIAYVIARHHAFMQSRSIVRDFEQSFLRTFFSLLIFVSLFVALQFVAGYHPEPAAPAILSYLIVIMQMGAAPLFAVTDRILLPRWMARYRRQLGRLQTDALTVIDANNAFAKAASAVNEITEQARYEYLQTVIREEIEHLFQYRHFEDDLILNRSRLQELTLVQQELTSGTVIQNVGDHQAGALRRVLVRLLDLPCDALSSEADHGVTQNPENIGLMIMRKQYVDHLSRSQVETILQEQYGLVVRGGVYSRYLLKGRTRFASILYQAELAAIENTLLPRE